MAFADFQRILSLPAVHRFVLLSVIVLTGLCLPVNTIHGAEYLVSFSRMDELLDDRETPAVLLEWKVFRRVPGQIQFREHQPEELPGFLLRVNGEQIRIDSARYILKNVEIGRKYEVDIGLVRTAGVEDVTQQYNIRKGVQYNSGEFRLARMKITPDPPLFIQWILRNGGEVYQATHTFLKKGDVLYISYILSFMLFVGLLGAMFHLYRLFLIPEYRPGYIRARPLRALQSADPADAVGNLKGPAKHLIQIYQAGKRANGERIHAMNEREVSRAGKIEKSLSDRISAEINELEGMSGSGGSGRVNKLLSFFFSIEFFWDIGVVAPMLGLLGTVTGIAKAFGTVSILSSLESVREILESLSGGINEALFTTIGGLFVGVFFIGLYYLFRWRIDNIRESMDYVLDALMKRV